MSSSSEEDKPEFADASEVTSDSEATASNAQGGVQDSDAESTSEATASNASDVDPTSEPPLDGQREAEAEEAHEDEAEAEEADEDEDAPATPETRKRRRLRRGAKANRDDSKKPVGAPRRRRTTRKPGEPLPVVRAQAKYVRSSARKARLVCDHIRGKSVEDARAILAHTPRAVARDWSKLLESAIANAEHNHELVGEDLYVKVVQADEGPTIKRHRPRAQGRATKIRKRTAHLTILLTPKD